MKSLKNICQKVLKNSIAGDIFDVITAVSSRQHPSQKYDDSRRGKKVRRQRDETLIVYNSNSSWVTLAGRTGL